MRTVTVTERRARLARSHHLAAGHAAPGPVEAASSLVGLHASDPATVYLSVQARVTGFQVPALETELYEQGTLVKHLGMRGTVFVLPRELVPVVQAACTDAIAGRERKRLCRDVEQGGIATSGARWLGRTERATLAALAGLGEASGQQLSRAVPELQAKLVYAEGKPWGGQVGLATRVFTILAAERKIVRGRPATSWLSSQHRWRLASEPAEPGVPELEARTELVRRWLASFGPATEVDVAWWTGLGLTRVREALAGLDVVAVDLEGEPGLALAEDLAPEPDVEPWAALLPSLDPTTMGWRQRDWYLGEHGPALFDTNGNAGPTAWWHGRVVGGWSQRASGEVVYRLLEDVGADAARAIEHEAERLTTWAGGAVVTPRFPTPLDRELRG